MEKQNMIDELKNIKQTLNTAGHVLIRIIKELEKEVE